MRRCIVDSVHTASNHTAFTKPIGMLHSQTVKDVRVWRPWGVSCKPDENMTM